MSLPKDGGVNAKNPLKKPKALEPKPVLVAAKKDRPATAKPVRK